MKTLIALCLIVIINVQLPAGEIQSSDTLEYILTTEVLITAPRLKLSFNEAPFSTSIVEKDIIQELPSSIALDEPTKLVPGVMVYRFGKWQIEFKRT